VAIPVLLHVASASQALPIVAAALVGERPLPVPHRRLALWCCLLVLLDVVDLAVGANTGNNLWTGYLTLPVEIGMTLWILSSWQSPRWARAYLLAVPVIGATVAIVLSLTDPLRTFDVWVSPILALLALAASLQTLVLRALQSRDALVRLDWFWICLGMAIFWVVQVSSPVFAFAFMRPHQDWVVTILLFRAGLMILSFVCMSWGIACLRTRPR
jgi:hypothetical protein